MLVMNPVERKIRLPGNLGANNANLTGVPLFLPCRICWMAGDHLKITAIAIIVGIVWGTLLAVMRLSSFKPLAGLPLPTLTFSALSRW